MIASLESAIFGLFLMVLMFFQTCSNLSFKFSMSLLKRSSFLLKMGMLFLFAPPIRSFIDFTFDCCLHSLLSSLPVVTVTTLVATADEVVPSILHLSNPSYPLLKYNMSMQFASKEHSKVQKDRMFRRFPKIFHKTKSQVFLKQSKCGCERNSRFLNPFNVLLPLFTWKFLLGRIKHPPFSILLSCTFNQSLPPVA